MTDIAPEILERVEAIFQNRFTKDKTIADLHRRVQQGTATYKEVNEYAVRTGEILAEALRRGVSSSELPDGRMYYNIAERVLTPTLTNNYEIVSGVAVQVQESLNKAAGIGIKAIKPELNTDRIDGLVNKVSAAQSFEAVAWVMDDPVVNFTQSVVDDAIKANADFQVRAGLRPKIVRKVVGGCCDWCAALAGTFDYGSEPKDVYRRHAYCRCQVTYDPGSGKRQNVHTKQWTDPGEVDKIEERKQLALGDLGTFRPKQYSNTIGSYVSVDRAKVLADAKAGARNRHAGVYTDAMAKSKKELQKSIVSRTAQVERHAEKIQHPEKYVSDWESRDPRYKAGLIRKWEKDMTRNAEQAEIELAVFKERF